MESVSTFNELFPPPAASSSRGPSSIEELGSDAFLKLMVAQMENQDPTKPMDNMQFIAQLAQFGSVSGIQELNDSFAGLSSSLTSNQAMQAANLVGRSVVTNSNLGSLQQIGIEDNDPVMMLNATVDLGGSASGGNLFIQDATGRLVYTTALPPSQGDLKISWDGRDRDGNLMPPGRYRVSAEATINGESQSVSVYAHQQVQSVAVDGITGGVSLELANGEDVPINEIKAFL